jgi:hypothetical protein
MLEQNHNFSDLDSIFNFIKNDLKRPKMNPPKSDDLLWDIRTDLELDEDLIVGNLSYLSGSSMPPQIQITNALKLPEIFSSYIRRIENQKLDKENVEYSKSLIQFINDLSIINNAVVKFFK